jgi:predicted DCC family thiol-disulfide oxidoreductase YuxK
MFASACASWIAPPSISWHPKAPRAKPSCRAFHARDANGDWLRGVDVFAAVYEAAGFPRIARVCRSAMLRPLLDRMYPWIAAHRRILSALGLARLFHLARRPACVACAKV